MLYKNTARFIVSVGRSSRKAGHLLLSAFDVFHARSCPCFKHMIHWVSARIHASKLRRGYRDIC